MPEKPKYKLTESQIRAIENVANRGDRTEIVPVKDGLKILRIRREAVKTENE